MIQKVEQFCFFACEKEGVSMETGGDSVFHISPSLKYTHRHEHTATNLWWLILSFSTSHHPITLKSKAVHVLSSKISKGNICFVFCCKKAF